MGPGRCGTYLDLIEDPVRIAAEIYRHFDWAFDAFRGYAGFVRENKVRME